MLSKGGVVIVVVLIEITFVSDFGGDTTQDNDQRGQGPPADEASLLSALLTSLGGEEASLNTAFKVFRLVLDLQWSRRKMASGDSQVRHQALAASCPRRIVKNRSFWTWEAWDGGHAREPGETGA